TFGELTGEKVKTSPKGFSADDPAIELLRHKQFLVYKYLTDEEVLGSKLVHMINETFQAMRPFFDVMSDYLTTDLNGESLLDA
ncbi:MAG TPA: TIGR02453 family protein, partial [Cytophagales bacterium]|nr:TIGR02453 family protein [Cytophagales bacterium]